MKSTSQTQNALPAPLSPKQITRLLTKVAFQAAEIEGLKKDRKALNQKATRRHENAEKKTACANCEKMANQLKQLQTETKVKKSINRVLRKWYPEDYD